MKVPGHHLAQHFRELGCRLVEHSLSIEACGLSHVEDAAPGTISWYRGGELPESFPGDVLVARSDAKIDVGAPLIAFHPDPRMVLRKTILAYGLADYSPQIVRGPGGHLHTSAILGARGQGYDFEDGKWASFPHAGGLRVGTDVDIGPCATIMRGSIGDTVIGDGCKIGNGVNIGHDTRIGDHTLIIAGALIAGWVRIGTGVKIWQGAIVKNGIRIGDGAEIGMGSVVLKDVPAKEVWVGNPARRAR